MFDNPVRPLRQLLIALPLFVALSPLAGCDMIQQKMGLEDPAAKEARAEAEGRAVGGACRHSGRAIEDCYAIYTGSPKSAVFAGWRDMDAYMRDNKIETIEPILPPPQPPEKKKKTKEEGGTDSKPAKESKTSSKSH